MKDSQRDDTPVLITEAAPSYDDQYAARRKKYAIMMSLRVPFLVGAVAVWSVGLWVLALVLIAASVPLPWIAVLIANDRPPKRSEKVHRFQRSGQRAMEERNHEVIES